ncbi:TadE/TadG family type IV pilus assembly protein [Sphingomonas sp.]|jgi:Flp pilus assembly protein TadG|uniref:TadE/TadG family type IV pilus assembly protein n=1 Tax=Sphingomonas sp. TaxID=28214 RepID=UPI002D80DB87|nr:TadE/TadG family type IV pilus assembly protein [Sphingomonas sp.]HEU0044979.1 TadE/TadG family type IV pilus assembly protein [Sphingomonas sp.]
MIARLNRLRRDLSGATIVEFGFVAPVMCVLIMGLGDLLHQVYAQSVLNGEVQKAARDSGIEGGATSTATIDAKVVRRMLPVVKNLSNSCAADSTGAVWCSTRRSYDNFTEIRPEPFTDADDDDIRDPGECFTDQNGNRLWDEDPGIVGQGGAGAATSYTMNITYPHIFPVMGLLGWSSRQTITATTVLKNQPYATQTEIADVKVCT